MTTLRVLTARDVQSALSMADCIAAVREAFGQLSAGQAAVPVRTQWSGQGGTALVMPGYLPARGTGQARGSLGAKIVSVFPDNPARSLPTVNALVVLLQSDTGVPVAVLDGASLTALRTGAASGVATDLLAPAGANTLALFGAGVQARTQLLAVCAVRRIRTVWVYDPSQARAGQLAREMAGQAPIPADVRVALAPRQALEEAQIVATATTSKTPVFADADLRSGAHVNAVGAFTPEMQEIPAETVARARVFVDQVVAALAEAGDLIVPLREGNLDAGRLVEIGSVINGQAAGRERPDQVTLFKSVGNAVQDLAAAARAVTVAEQRGLGTLVTL